jgi:peptidoglycan/xylan/chitin deacetylase (PgdA/CDA1 family)
MNKSEIINAIYYKLKPLIPREVQIWLRRKVVIQKRPLYENVWPIDKKCSKPPNNWSGWPENKRFALVLTHDVDTNRGQEKCKLLMELEKNLGFRSSFNFVPMRYVVQGDLQNALTKDGFEVGVHGLYHDGQYFESREKFRKRADKINNYLKEWGSVGYRSPSMLHNLDWFHDLNIKYDSSTFDTDPFEPQSDGKRTIFPFFVQQNFSQKGYVELPYTLPQDFTLFVLMKEKDVGIWKIKLDWIVEHGGMVLLNVHPDYMNFSEKKSGLEEYPAKYYEEFLQYVKSKYGGQYWHVLPKDIADFWLSNMVRDRGL